MFIPTSACLSALTKRTKRVQVQLLKDFPKFQLRAGEVVNVKPSLMRNFLHNENGARYILKESDIDQTLLSRSKKSSESSSQNVTKKAVPKEKNTKPVVAKQPQQNGESKAPEAPSSALNQSITIEKVKIPGLEL
ncbi:54S ribosomal protein L50 [Kluyveromyces marxianus]|uniref:54S ribosomal protein L50 n=2 Tax=Kluyveromyces marxianus TaxID=4911 RepID=W0TCE7_KLUMD|nr:54S ribosomal protein L50 [Kluyveromyces marxianus DMKU3-1042]QGN15498.1 54S ribosomal protein L50 [Kluyveromyces marxianus]BAO39784.1 54S ribosomal protein L50 [Kluyveromyces marxianus DMKU3-1042]BAP71268.1 54S ribosomal protein L50 [Kluyveromyces marxianus]